MRVVSCLHPVIVNNRYTGEQVAVPCGKCSACVNSRSARWVQRIDEECRHHRYNLFLTLQYNDLDIPQFIRLRKEDTPFIDGREDWSYIDSETGQILSFYDSSISRHTKADREFIFDTKVLNVLSKRDVQLFLKKFNYYARQITNHYGNYRYYICGEYGGRTFRPHYHVLLFFDDQQIIENIDSLLAKSWQHGNIYDPHPISGSAAQYVASYLNCTADLPSIYQHRQIRQFALFSKHPAIGTISFLQEDIKQIFDEAAIKLRLHSVSKNAFIDVPLWRTFQDRCFPRIPRFALLSHSDRVTLYSFGTRFLDSSAGACAEWLRRYYVRSYESRQQKQFLDDYTKNGKVYCKDFIATRSTYDSFLYRYFYDISKLNYFNKLTKCLGVKDSKTSLLNFVYIVRRVCATAHSYGITIDEYVTKIEEFYDKIQKSNFIEQIRFQDVYFKLHPDESHALYFDAALIDRCNLKRFTELSVSDQHLLKLAGIVDDSVRDGDVIHLDYADCFDYVDLRSTHELISHEMTKTKLMNDYVYSRSEKFKNILNYYKNLEDL